MDKEKQGIAEKIVTRLFTNGFGEEAERLVLELPNGHESGGRCKQSAIDVVNEEIAALKAEIKRKDKALKNALFHMENGELESRKKGLCYIDIKNGIKQALHIKEESETNEQG